MPLGGTGPVLVSSVALAFNLLGVSLFSARLVMAIFLIISIIGLYLLIREVSRWEVALLSVFIFLVAGYSFYDTLWLGRQVLAEVPSLAFLFLGLWGLVKVLKQQNIPIFILSLVFLGLSVVTKNQLVWILVPTMAIMTFGDLVILKKSHWKVYLTSVIVIALVYSAWYFAQIIIVGRDNSASYQEIQAYNFLVSYLRFGFSKIKENFNLLRNSGFLFPIIISCLYFTFSIFKKKGKIDQERALLLVLAVLGLFSSIFMGLPWARYIYTGIVFTIPILGLLINDLILWLKSHRKTLLWYGFTISLVAFMSFVALRLISDMSLIVETKNNDAQQFAEFVDHKVPAGSEVLNWEWDVEFYSHSDFVHPDFRLFPALVDQTYNKINSPILQNNRNPAGAHYLIIGPFASQIGAFTEEEDQHAITSLGQVGEYALFYLK